MKIPKPKRVTIHWGNNASGRRLVMMTAVVFSVTGSAGCQLSTPRIEMSPLSYPQQAAEILKLVPLDTDRDVTVEKLEQAGIQGDFSPVSQSVYYCNIWKREDGKRWWMNVALLFDESGKFYATRNPESRTEIDYGIQSPTANQN